jgi:hypothetical protein
MGQARRKDIESIKQDSEGRVWMYYRSMAEVAASALRFVVRAPLQSTRAINGKKSNAQHISLASREPLIPTSLQSVIVDLLKQSHIAIGEALSHSESTELALASTWRSCRRVPPCRSFLHRICGILDSVDLTDHVPLGDNRTTQPRRRVYS